MEFHPQKCQVLRITNKRNIIKRIYNIHNIPLEETSSAKYLGVTIDSKLNWKRHISETVKKANKTLSFIRRNLLDCPSNVKIDCYTTLVRPILEYGSVVWDPHHKTDIENIEKVQKRAARFATSNYKMEEGSTRTNMIQLNWKPLVERRAELKLLTFFKAKHQLVDIPFYHLKQNVRRSNNFFIPPSNVDSHLHSFYPSTIRLWNSLPNNLKILIQLTPLKTT